MTRIRKLTPVSVGVLLLGLDAAAPAHAGLRFRGLLKAWHPYNLPRWGQAMAMTAVTVLWASAASADVLLFSSNAREQDFTTSSSPSTTILDLNGSGGTKLSFITTAPNQRVSIIFNASCIITSTDPLTSPDAGFIVINILVDPAGSVGEFAAPPANALFCAISNAHDSKNGERGVVVASARPAQAGTNTVRVQARLVSFFAGSTLTFTLQTVSVTVTR